MASIIQRIPFLNQLPIPVPYKSRMRVRPASLSGLRPPYLIVPPVEPSVLTLRCWLGGNRGLCPTGILSSVGASPRPPLISYSGLGLRPAWPSPPCTPDPLMGLPTSRRVEFPFAPCPLRLLSEELRSLFPPALLLLLLSERPSSTSLAVSRPRGASPPRAPSPLLPPLLCRLSSPLLSRTPSLPRLLLPPLRRWCPPLLSFLFSLLLLHNAHATNAITNRTTKTTAAMTPPLSASVQLAQFEGAGL